MKIKCKAVPFITFILISISTNVLSWDGQRKGFILGIGFGKSDLSYNLKEKHFDPFLDSEYEYEQRISNLSNFASDFKIGYAPNNHLIIHWTSKICWFEERTIKTTQVEEENFSSYSEYYKSTNHFSGVAGIGMIYFFKDTCPSAFVTTSLGCSNIADLDKGENHFGFGLTWGAGYEFAKHWYGELDFCLGFPKQSKSDEISLTKVFSILFTLNCLGY